MATKKRTLTARDEPYLREVMQTAMDTTAAAPMLARAIEHLQIGMAMVRTFAAPAQHD